MRRFAFAVLLAPALALAEDGRAVRLEVDAPAGCTDQARFAARVHARTARVTIAPGAATTVRVRISARERGVEGEVTLAEGGRETRRRVEGASCGEVVEALALITAVAIDPTASTSASASAAEAEAPPERAKPAAHAVADAGAPAADAGAVASPAEAPPVRPVPPEPEVARVAAPADAGEARASRPAWRASIGANAALTSGVAPDPLLSVPVFLDVSRETPAVFAPALRLRFERSGSGAVTVVGGAAHFTWTAGSLEACPVAWSSTRVHLRPCARVEIGVLDGAGLAVAPERSQARLWISGSAVARAQVVVIGPLFLELEAGALFPFTRDRFFVEPDVTIHRAPIAAWTAAGGAGVTFW